MSTGEKSTTNTRDPYTLVELSRILSEECHLYQRNMSCYELPAVTHHHCELNDFINNICAQLKTGLSLRRRGKQWNPSRIVVPCYLAHYVDSLDVPAPLRRAIVYSKSSPVNAGWETLGDIFTAAADYDTPIVSHRSSPNADNRWKHMERDTGEWCRSPFLNDPRDMFSADPSQQDITLHCQSPVVRADVNVNDNFKKEMKVQDLLRKQDVTSNEPNSKSAWNSIISLNELDRFARSKDFFPNLNEKLASEDSSQSDIGMTPNLTFFLPGDLLEPRRLSQHSRIGRRLFKKFTSKSTNRQAKNWYIPLLDDRDAPKDSSHKFANIGRINYNIGDKPIPALISDDSSEMSDHCITEEIMIVPGHKKFMKRSPKLRRSCVYMRLLEDSDVTHDSNSAVSTGSASHVNKCSNIAENETVQSYSNPIILKDVGIGVNEISFLETIGPHTESLTSEKSSRSGSHSIECTETSAANVNSSSSHLLDIGTTGKMCWETSSMHLADESSSSRHVDIDSNIRCHLGVSECQIISSLSPKNINNNESSIADTSFSRSANGAVVNMVSSAVEAQMSPIDGATTSLSMFNDSNVVLLNQSLISSTCDSKSYSSSCSVIVISPDVVVRGNSRNSSVTSCTTLHSTPILSVSECTTGNASASSVFNAEPEVKVEAPDKNILNVDVGANPVPLKQNNTEDETPELCEIDDSPQICFISERSPEIENFSSELTVSNLCLTPIPKFSPIALVGSECNASHHMSSTKSTAADNVQVPCNARLIPDSPSSHSSIGSCHHSADVLTNQTRQLSVFELSPGSPKNGGVKGTDSADSYIERQIEQSDQLPSTGHKSSSYHKSSTATDSSDVDLTFCALPDLPTCPINSCESTFADNPTFDVNVCQLSHSNKVDVSNEPDMFDKLSDSPHESSSNQQANLGMNCLGSEVECSGHTISHGSDVKLPSSRMDDHSCGIISAKFDNFSVCSVLDNIQSSEGSEVDIGTSPIRANDKKVRFVPVVEMNVYSDCCSSDDTHQCSEEDESQDASPEDDCALSIESQDVGAQSESDDCHLDRYNRFRSQLESVWKLLE